MHSGGSKPHLACMQVALRQTCFYCLAGTATGGLFSLQCPDLEIYSTVRAHKVPILGTVPLGDGIVSISQDRVRWHSSGGFPRATLTIAQVTLIFDSLLQSQDCIP